MVKVCSKCKVEKPLTEFNKNKKNKDNYRSECKYCSKDYYKVNKEKINKQKKEYYKDNKEKILDKQKEYQKQRIKTDPMFKLKKLLRDRSQKAFKRKGYSKNTKTQEMLGVDWEIAKKHIERQFKKGMSWSNQGEWHIDHIIPLASANTPERLKQLCHYTNLQPLWAIDNLSKSDNIKGQQTLLRI